MKNLKNFLKKTIPLLVFTACSSSPAPIDELNKYNLENKSLYQNFKELMENRTRLFSEDKMTFAWMDSKNSRVIVSKEYDKQTKITFMDYGINGLTINDEIIDYEIKFIKELDPESRLSTAKKYTFEVQKLMGDNQK